MSPAWSAPAAPLTSASESNGLSEVPSPPGAALSSTYHTRGVATSMVIWPVSVRLPDASLSLTV